MSEWDSDETGLPGKGKKKNDYTGKLNIPMTLACFLAVAVISFLAAWLMKDTARSFWELGLTFAAPFAALMGSAMLVERSTGRMTPQCSRNAQMICVLVTVAAAFCVGCLSEVTHTPVVIKTTESKYDYLIVVDKSASMDGKMDTASIEAIHGLVGNLEDGTGVGIVAFGSKVIGTQAILPLDSKQRGEIEKTANKRPNGGTDFSAAMDSAMRLIENMPERKRTVRIILVTDGDDLAIGNFDEFNTWAARLNALDSTKDKVELCAIQAGNVPMLAMVRTAVDRTGGVSRKAVEANDLVNEVSSMQVTEISEKSVDTLQATYNGQTNDGKPNTPYMILTAVLLVLQGVLSGFALKIMFSVQGQFRFQTILSPLMGLTAFLILNFGRFIGIAPAWICEGTAFSAFGIVFMRENLNTGRNIPASGSSGKKKNTSAKPAEAFDGDAW